MKNSNTDQNTNDFNDNEFLKDWLEKRYGCGFAQMVVDDVCAQEMQIHISCDTSESIASNDNNSYAIKHSA